MYFECCNAFLPLVAGSDPFACARAFIEDNSSCMLTYIMVSASAYTALRCAAEEDFARRKKKAVAHGQISKAHADILHDIIKGIEKAFMVRLLDMLMATCLTA